MVDTMKFPNEEHSRRNVMGLQVLGGTSATQREPSSQE